MKTTKVILVAALMAFATIGFAQSDAAQKNVKPGPPELSALISIKAAMQNYALVRAMRTQLTPNFLIVDQKWYTVPVKYKKTVIYIYGSYRDWKHFFAIKPHSILKSK